MPQSPWKLPRTTASRHHAAASSNAPAAKASVPSDVPANPRSTMMRASIGNAVMHIDAPRNSTASHVLTPSVKNNPLRPAIHAPSNPPSRNGAAIPAIDTLAAARARPRNRSDRNSTPTRNMYNASPTWLTDRKIAFDADGKTHCCKGRVHSKCPSSEGPSTTPVIISPTTCGWPTRFASQPTSRHAPSTTASCRKKRMESSKGVMNGATLGPLLDSSTQLCPPPGPDHISTSSGRTSRHSSWSSHRMAGTVSSREGTMPSASSTNSSSARCAASSSFRS